MGRKSKKALLKMAARQGRAAAAIRKAFLRNIQRAKIKFRRRPTLSKAPAPSLKWVNDLNIYYRIKKLKKGKVDALMRFDNLPEGMTAHQILLGLSDAKLFKIPRNFNFWVQTGFIGSLDPVIPEEENKKQLEGFESLTKDQKYQKYAGQEMVEVHSQPVKRMAANLQGVMNIAETLEGRGKHPTQITFRVFWQPDGRRKKRK